MTYTFKLARRLAILRDLAMLTVLAVLLGCTGDAMAPDTSESELGDFQRLRVVPGTVTIQTNQPIRFRGEMPAPDGKHFSTRVTWEASGGLIDDQGNFTASEPGVYKVVGRGRGRN
jgi:hypothetical protein